jgi:hypothetical protein
VLPVLFDSNAALFLFIYFDQAIDIALVATFFLETLPPVKSSEGESRQGMTFFLAILYSLVALFCHPKDFLSILLAVVSS